MSEEDLAKEKQKEFLSKQLVKIRQKQKKIIDKELKFLKQNTPMNSKEQFQEELDKLNLSDELKAAAFTILDIGLAKLNRLPISITQEDKISVKLEYYNHANSIMYVEGNIYGKYKYCDLESGLGDLELEECFSNRANLKLVQKLRDLETCFEFMKEDKKESTEKWNKLHSFLNSILELNCKDGCITDDEELILAVKAKLEFEK